MVLCCVCKKELSQLTHSSTAPDTNTIVWLCPIGNCYIYWRGYLAGYAQALTLVEKAFRQPQKP